mgnify:CR=1 FL=1
MENKAKQNIDIQNASTESLETNVQKTKKKKKIAIIVVIVTAIIVISCMFSEDEEKGNLSVTLDDYKNNLIHVGLTPAELDDNWSSWTKLDDGGYACTYNHATDCKVCLYADDDKNINRIIILEEGICPSNGAYKFFRASERGEALFLAKFVSAINGADENEAASTILNCINSGDGGTSTVEELQITYREEIEYHCGAIIIE